MVHVERDEGVRCVVIRGAGEHFIAAADAFFTLAYCHLGTSPDGSGTYFLPRLVGMKRAAETESFAECALCEDFKEGIRAFVEKRAPRFTGR